MNWNGEKLSIACDRRGVSPSELADRLEVSRQTVYHWMSGRDPKGAHLLQICQFLEVDPSDMYDGKRIEEPDYYGNTGKLFKKTGIRLVYALLTDPRRGEDWGNDLLNIPVRELARKAKMSTGSASELLSEMRARGFLLVDGRYKRLVNLQELFNQWLNGYKDYRFKLQVQYFQADTISWWRKRDSEREGFLWGGEPAGAILTDGFLRPEKLTIYTEKPLYDLVVDGNLHQVSSGGNVEFVKPFLRVEGEQACVNPLLVYADLICSSDDRNGETARRINDRYLRRIIDAD